MKRKLTLGVISFKQTETEPEYLYALNYDRLPEIGEYIDMFEYRNRETFQSVYGNLGRIQPVLTPDQINKGYPVIEACTNPKYDLPRIPEAFVKAYTQSPGDYPRIELWLPAVKEVVA